MSSVVIGNRKIGEGYEPFIIAEMSNNHNQSLETALEIVDAAAAAGAHAVKLQTYTADIITIDSSDDNFFISDNNSLWKGTTLYDLYKSAYTPWEWHETIFKRCKENGLIAFSSPFDETAIDFLESLQVPCYKIASFENTDLIIIKKAASTGKPLIISTGMSTVAELDETVRVARDYGSKDIVLLKCTSAYPAPPEAANLRTIPHMKELFNCEVGLSDHTLGIGVALAGITLGASVIEKHFTLSRANGGVDSAFSMEPLEMKSLVQESYIAWKSLGQVSYGPTGQEFKSLQFRRSLYVTKDIKKGDLLNKDNLRSIRPGNGLPSKYYDVLLGKRVNRDIKRGTPMTWDYIS